MGHWEHRFRTKERQRNCTFPPPKFLTPGGSWVLIHCLNIAIVFIFFINGTIMGIYYSLLVSSKTSLCMTLCVELVKLKVVDIIYYTV
jgi:hypothetical protein